DDEHAEEDRVPEEDGALLVAFALAPKERALGLFRGRLLRGGAHAVEHPEEARLGEVEEDRGARDEEDGREGRLDERDRVAGHCAVDPSRESSRLAPVLLHPTHLAFVRGTRATRDSWGEIKLPCIGCFPCIS